MARGNDQTAESPQLVANSFIRDAEEYVENARQLIAAQGRGTRKIMRSYPSIYFQLSHAIELALKAYLAASAVPIETLRDRIGHDLELALRCAQRHGFAPPEGFSELVQRLAPYHLDDYIIPRCRAAASGCQPPDQRQKSLNRVDDNSVLRTVGPYRFA